ncbi:MAG: phosphomannomutase/phosphoglucomutase [Proteobacteria bacterium]|nr:phosphomannomutase/phosphoglucomutase [Pseudomonadota bacterium]
MGKDEHDKPKTDAAIKAALGRLRLPIAAVLVLLAILVGWDGWHQGVAGRAQATVASEGARLQKIEQNLLTEIVAHFDQAASAPAVVAAVSTGDVPAATRAFERQWSDGKTVKFLTTDLKDAYADPKRFGFGRLAVLNSTQRHGVSRVGVARVDGQPRLVVAGAVKQGGETKVLALVDLPIDDARTPVTAANPGSGFVALSFHGYDVAVAGDRAVVSLGDNRQLDVGDSGFVIRTSSPQPAASLFGADPIVDYVLAALLLAGGFALLKFGARLAEAGAGGEPGAELTVAEQAAAEAAAAATTAAPKVEVKTAPKPAAVAISREIFRAYDIRGEVGKNLDASVARLIGMAIGTVMQEQGLRDIVVGRDGRTSGPEMVNALIDGLRLAGREVIDIGQAATPVCYFGAFNLRTGSCVAVTGSHNPPDYNGFKIVLGGDTLAGDAITDLYARIAEDRLYKSTTQGGLQQRTINADYVQRIAEDIQLERKLKVVVDAGNGVAGLIAPEVLEAIGAEVAPIFCEVDGSFPNHHPDPSEPKNLADAIQMVQRLEADIGLAFDGDGDRLGVVTRAGEIIFPDRLLMLFAEDVLSRNPGACIVYDVKCTGHLAGHILGHGGSPLMWKTGHSLIKAKMKETGAELAGEMSGHFFFKERWYGFDDGIYAAARLLEILAARPETADEIFAELPKGFSTPELKVPMEGGDAHGFVEKFREQAKFDGARVSTIDGVRADWPDGWGLVRASNTTPVLVLRFDADSPEALARIHNAFREQLLAVQGGLALPF